MIPYSTCMCYMYMYFLLVNQINLTVTLVKHKHTCTCSQHVCFRIAMTEHNLSTVHMCVLLRFLIPMVLMYAEPSMMILYNTCYTCTSYVQKPILATFWLHVYCNFWQFANFGNLLHTGFPIGDHVNQKLPFLEICQFWQQLHTGFPIRNHVNQKLPFLEICHVWQFITRCFPGDHVNQKLPFLEI